MKRIVYILLLLLALLLTACGKANTQTPTVTTDPTTAPTSAPTVAPTATAISEEENFQKLIKDNWWYWRALGCTFEKPEDISAKHFFYMGLSQEDEKSYDISITPEEQSYIDDAYRQKSGREPSTVTSVIKLPVAAMNKALSILDITTEDIKIPSHWVYYDKTDAYYFWVSDAYGVVGWKVTKVEKGTNGTVAVYWETSQFPFNTATEEHYQDGTKMVMTMQEKPDGSYRILSNVPVEPLGPVTADDFTKFIKDEYWYYRALGCTFEKPEDIPAEFFFYGGLSAEEVNAYCITITPEEQTYINAVYRQENGRDPYTGATKLPVPAMNNALSILGVTVEDIEIPDHWVYYDKTNAYYFWVSDAYGVVGWNITQVEKTADGIVRLYWESPDAWNTQTDKAYPRGTKMVMTLKEQTGGSYLILSNVPVE